MELDDLSHIKCDRMERIKDCLLIQGDCLDILPQLPDGCVDAVVTDPPYGVNFQGKNTKFTVRKNAGYISGDDNTIGPKVIAECIDRGWRAVVTPGNRLAWDYPSPADIGSVFCPSGAGRGRWGFVGTNLILYYGKCPYLAKGMGHRPNSFSSFANSEDNGHPCPKPIEWMEWLVLKASAEMDETILDPFMGSGTTGVACIKTGRKFIGIEKEPKYFDISVHRIANYLGKDLPEKTRPAGVFF